MRILFHNTALKLLIGAAILFGSLVPMQAASVTIQIIADNDFALFSGTQTTVDRVLYQNDVPWSQQLQDASTFTFALQPGETTFYLLGMGGGGDENISGTVNGVDITTIPVSMSSDLSSYLTGYAAADVNGSVANGTYSASLTDVQAAFPHLTWGAPTPTDGQYVASVSPTGKGYEFGSNTAHLFGFTARSVGAFSSSSVPEPATYLLLSAGLLAAGLLRRRHA